MRAAMMLAVMGMLLRRMLMPVMVMILMRMNKMKMICLGSVQLTIGPTVFWSLHSPSCTVLSCNVTQWW